MKQGMNKILMTVISMSMLVSLLQGFAPKTQTVQAAQEALTGTSAVCELDFDGTFKGYESGKYNKKAESRNTPLIRFFEETSTVLSKKMYMEADIAMPNALVSKIREGKSRLIVSGWIDYTVTDKYIEDDFEPEYSIYESEEFQHWYVVTSSKEYYSWESIEGKEDVVYDSLEKTGKFSVLHVSYPIIASDETNDFNAKEIVYNLSFTGDVLFDDMKLYQKKDEQLNINMDVTTGYNLYARKVIPDQYEVDANGNIDYYYLEPHAYELYALGESSASTTVNKTSLVLYRGNATTVKAATKGISQNINYQVSNPAIASVMVNENGVATIKGIKAGTTYLYTTANGITKKTKITVKVKKNRKKQ